MAESRTRSSWSQQVTVSRPRVPESGSRRGNGPWNVRLADRTVQGQDGPEEPPNAQVLLTVNWQSRPPRTPSIISPVTGYQNFLRFLFRNDALRGKQGLPLAWRWLIWRLIGCIGDRCYRSNVGTCKTSKHRLRS